MKRKNLMCGHEPKIKVQYGHWTVIGLRPVIFDLRYSSVIHRTGYRRGGDQTSQVQVLAVLGGDGHPVRGDSWSIAKGGIAPMHEEYPCWILSSGRILGRNWDTKSLKSFLTCYSQVTSTNKNLNEIVRLWIRLLHISQNLEYTQRGHDH